MLIRIALRRNRVVCAFLFSLVILLVSGCQKTEEPGLPAPEAGPDAKTEEAVVYLRSPVPQKINNDALLLVSREILLIERQRIFPNERFVESILNNSAKYESKEYSIGRFNVLVDRVQWVVCLDGQCAKIESICPSRDKRQSGELCRASGV